MQLCPSLIASGDISVIIHIFELVANGIHTWCIQKNFQHLGASSSHGICNLLKFPERIVHHKFATGVHCQTLGLQRVCSDDCHCYWKLMKIYICIYVCHIYTHTHTHTNMP